MEQTAFFGILTISSQSNKRFLGSFFQLFAVLEFPSQYGGARHLQLMEISKNFETRLVTKII